MSVLRNAWGLPALCCALFVGAAARADDFLDPDQAFQVSARVLPGKRIELHYGIAPGYYLYRDRFKFVATGATLGDPQIPAGKKHYDTALEQTVEIYHDQVVVTLPVTAADKTFTLRATHQGCAEKGLCYPPQPRTIQVSLRAFGAQADGATLVSGDVPTTPAGPAGAGFTPAPAPAAPMSVAPTTGDPLASLRRGVPGAVETPQLDRPAASQAAAGVLSTIFVAPTAAVTAPPVPATLPPPSVAPPKSEDQRIGAALASGHLLTILSIAFVLGLGLSLTPCVWPMLPILSSIIVGQGRQVTARRGFALAVTYSLGMALVYTALGVAAGLLGQGFSGFLQSPSVLVAFSALLALLSLSMFGFYELQLPAVLRDRLSARNEALSGGQLGGVFGMGVLSALIVSPCVSAPLVGALVYIGQTHDALLGGLALFAIAAGMSVPLLVIGASAGSVLPRSGAWMEQVKRAFGLVLLGVALYIVQPVVPGLAAMLAWGVLAIVSASTLGAFEPVAAGTYAGTARTVKGFGLVLAVFGVLEFVGAASGGRDPAQPLSHLAAAPGDGAPSAAVAGAAPRFESIASVAELDRRLQAAGRPALLDFYADWCVSCKEMEKQTFVDPAVRAKLANAVLLRADVTANTEDDRALLKRFGLFGPPGLIFFDARGGEVAAARVVGFQDAPRFVQSLAGAGL